MNIPTRSLLQVVPQLPGTHDGVGDYASKLAQRLQADYAIETTFAAPPFHPGNPNKLSNSAGIILHYVNYGYQRRGVPRQLPSILRRLKQTSGGHLLTIFHELFASGPPWGSAFWLQPIQKSIAREIGRASDACVVSSETMGSILRRLVPDADIRVHPVFSNFGEPSLTADQLTGRSPHRWVICGGTALVERSLRSFREITNRIPPFCFPHELFVLGGKQNPAIRSLFRDLPNIRAEYRPEIAPAEASEILSSCSFDWLDYFRRAGVPAGVLLKSSAFAAACAHGIITILPHSAQAIGVAGDQLPGPYRIDGKLVELPEDWQNVAIQIYQWYQRRAASGHLARGVAEVLNPIP
jgi:hypothetical protein